MAASPEQIAKVRRLTAESDPRGAYSDQAIAEHIEENALPYRDSATGRVYRPGQIGWVETYDLNAAAADVWDEKAAAAAQKYTVSVDGTVLTGSQVYQQYKDRSLYFRSRSTPVSVRAGR